MINQTIKKICRGIEKRWTGMSCTYAEKRANYVVNEEFKEIYAGITDTKPLYTYIRMISGLNYENQTALSSQINAWPIKMKVDCNCKAICMGWLYDRYELEERMIKALIDTGTDFKANERTQIRPISSVLDGYVVAKSEMGEMSTFRDEISIISITFEIKSERFFSSCDTGDLCLTSSDSC